MSDEYPVTPLVEAVYSGDQAAVRRILSAEPLLASAHDPNAFGATPLIHAVMRNDRSMVDLLLDSGAQIDRRSEWWAGSFGVLDHAGRAMAEHLLGRGATLTSHAAARLGKIDELRKMLDGNPALVHARGGDGQMPLHFASTVEIADLLLDRGAEIDARDLDHGSTAAQWLTHNDAKVASRLIARGCELDPFLVTMAGDLDRLRAVLRDEPDAAGVHVSRERFPVAQPAAGHIYLFNLGLDCTLLHAAAVAGRADIAGWLIEAGYDPDARGGYDAATPLHRAAWHDRSAAIAKLIEGGANMNLQSGEIHDNEPIGWAIVSGAVAAVRTLLERGARVSRAHLEQAACGARGEFRQFDRDRGLEAWAEIETLCAGGSDRV